jgi:hypothetical protein
VKNGKPVELLSIEKRRLLKRLSEKERKHKMSPMQPGTQTDWVVLDQVERKPPLAIGSEKD